MYPYPKQMANKRSSTLPLLVLALLAVALVLYALFFSEKNYNWAELYLHDADMPYGSSLLRDLLEESLPADRLHLLDGDLSDSGLLDSLEGPATYFFLGSEMYCDSADRAELLDFVSRGNTAFLASNQFNYALLDSLFTNSFFDLADELELYDGYIDRLLQQHNDSVVTLGFKAEEQARTELRYLIRHEAWMHNWVHFRDELEGKDGASAMTIGYLEGYLPNFIMLPYGEGHFLLHTTPLVFTNYALMDRRNFDYVNEVFKRLPEGDLLWDGYLREFRFERGNYTPPPYRHEDGMLKVILEERSLRWAWYTMLAIGLLFLFFGARRKQSPVPVVKRPENSSVEYAETIGKLYRIEGDHSKLTRLKMRLFKAYIRERYGIRTKVSEDQMPELIAKLAEKSHLPAAEIQAIFDTYTSIAFIPDERGEHLIKFHRLLENFYRHAR